MPIQGRTFCIFFLFLSGISMLSGQTNMIRGTIEHVDEGKIYLASYYGDRFRIVDSMETSSGAFYFMRSQEEPAGIYRIIYPDVYSGIGSENRFFEFIYNREDIEILVVTGEGGPVPFFENSLENQVYSEFMAFELDYEDKLRREYNQLYSTESDHPDHVSAVRVYDALQHQRTRFMDSLTAIYPGLYAIRIMNAFLAPVIPGSMSHIERIDTLKSCFFDHAAMDDPLLLYAPVYTFKLIDYLSLFKLDTLSMDQQEEQFIEAVDRIMDNVSPDPELRSFVVEFMLEGFDLLGMEQVQVHLADHYLDESCEADIVELVLSRMEGYKKMTAGQKAPDFVIRDINGKNHQLSHLSNRYVLVMFWASTCEHCQEMIPDLHEWYLQENSIGMEIIAISVDTSAAFFEAFVSESSPQWITSYDPLGWNGRVPGDYYLYATPSLFLLDGEQTILARPATFRQFLRAVKKLGS
ncbi:MAG: AhpC/TSA family protein [Bacteroidales bacterium]|nr:AhpC/TSA family protein [Bacteroidales bacterium]